MRCIFDPWITDPGTQTHIFDSLVTIFWVKSSINSLKIGQIVFFSISKNNLQFCEIKGYKNRYDNQFFSTLSFVAVFESGIRDG
jgi:hypothetical protein